MPKRLQVWPPSRLIWPLGAGKGLLPLLMVAETTTIVFGLVGSATACGANPASITRVSEAVTGGRVAGTKRCSNSSSRRRIRLRASDASPETRWPRFDHRLKSSERDFFDMFRFLFLTRVLNRGADRTSTRAERSDSSIARRESLYLTQDGTEPRRVFFRAEGTPWSLRKKDRFYRPQLRDRRIRTAAAARRGQWSNELTRAANERANGRFGKMWVLGPSVSRGAVSSDRAKDRCPSCAQLRAGKRDLTVRGLLSLAPILTRGREPSPRNDSTPAQDSSQSEGRGNRTSASPLTFLCSAEVYRCRTFRSRPAKRDRAGHPLCRG